MKKKFNSKMRLVSRLSLVLIFLKYLQEIHGSLTFQKSNHLLILIFLYQKTFHVRLVEKPQLNRKKTIKVKSLKNYYLQKYLVKQNRSRQQKVQKTKKVQENKVKNQLSGKLNPIYPQYFNKTEKLLDNPAEIKKEFLMIVVVQIKSVTVFVIIYLIYATNYRKK